MAAPSTPVLASIEGAFQAPSATPSTPQTPVSGAFGATSQTPFVTPSTPLTPPSAIINSASQAPLSASDPSSDPPEAHIAGVPAEILEMIIRNCNNEAGDYIGELCALARTCRRVHATTIPILYSGFKSYHPDAHEMTNLEEKRAALLLRTLVSKPEYGRHFRTISLTEKYVGGQWTDDLNRYKCGVNMRPFMKGGRRGKTALNQLKAQVDRLCRLPIWRFPAGQPLSAHAWGAFSGSARDPSRQPQDELMYDPKAFGAHWMRCLLYGHYDAVYALLLALTPEITSLQINAWATNWLKVPLEEPERPPQGLVNDFVSQLLRATAVAQCHTIQKPILTRLRTIKLYKDGPESDIPIALAIPYLLPPSVEEATLSGLWDARWFSTGQADEGGPYNGTEVSQLWPAHKLPSFHLRKLQIQNSLLDALSLGNLISCCEGLEWFSYGQFKQNTELNEETLDLEPRERIRLDIAILQPYFGKMTKTLRHFDFATNAEQDIRFWRFQTDHESRWEVWKGCFDFSKFERLEEIYVLSENFLDHSVDACSYQDFAAMLPLKSLKKLVIHNSLWTTSWKEEVDDHALHRQSRMERYAMLFIHMLNKIEYMVLKELVFIGQSDQNGHDAFHFARYPMVEQLKILCWNRGIDFKFKNLEADMADVVERDEVQMSIQEHEDAGDVEPRIEERLRRNSMSSEEGLIVEDDETEDAQDEARESDKEISADWPHYLDPSEYAVDPQPEDNGSDGGASKSTDDYTPSGVGKKLDALDEEEDTLMAEDEAEYKAIARRLVETGQEEVAREALSLAKEQVAEAGAGRGLCVDVLSPLRRIVAHMDSHDGQSEWGSERSNSTTKPIEDEESVAGTERSFSPSKAMRGEKYTYDEEYEGERELSVPPTKPLADEESEWQREPSLSPTKPVHNEEFDDKRQRSISSTKRPTKRRRMSEDQ